MPISRIVVLCAAVAALTACGADGRAPATPDAVRAPAPVALDAVPYTVVDPRTLTVAVPVGVGCTSPGRAAVEVAETATSVTVRASVRPPSPQEATDGQRCPVVLRTMPVTVELSAPLGGRTVLDGVGGRVVPAGAWPGLPG